MGFFSDLKEDLSQAVNELVPEDEISGDAVTEAAEGVPVSETPEEALELEGELSASQTEEAYTTDISGEETKETVPMPETAEDLGRMLDGMELNMMPEEEPEEELEGEVEETVREEEKQMEDTDYKGFETDIPENQGTPVDETAIITAGMTIKGDISSQGSLDIIGTVEGNIEILGKLNITGNIEGASSAADVYAEKARINGDVHSVGSIKIGQSTIVIGNIFANSAVIAGAVKGDIDVKGPVVLDTSAIVMGNIKSKSVQINNGAVIEGLCSQCYADVNPSSFFEDIKKARK